ncbi:MAG: hypothetical protein QGI32_18125 [Candidatus Latescibacteria bacterium]|nr:hypothetical protein [Candidatus Latescibacterota bacterium]
MAHDRESDLGALDAVRGGTDRGRAAGDGDGLASRIDLDDGRVTRTPAEPAGTQLLAPGVEAIGAELQRITDAQAGRRGGHPDDGDLRRHVLHDSHENGVADAGHGGDDAHLALTLSREQAGLVDADDG